MRRFQIDWFLAFRNIVRHRRRSAIAVGAVAFGVAALIVASGFVEWMLLTFREETIQSQIGHLQIVRPNYHVAGKADPFAFLLPNRMPEFEGESHRSQVKVVAPRLSFSGLVSHGDATLSFIGEGVAPNEEAAFGRGVEIAAGRNLTADAPRTVVVGVGLARNLGIKVGDRLVLLTNTASGGTNAVEVAVQGLFTTISKAYDDAALRVPIETARELLRTEGSHVWVALLKDTSATGRVLADLRTKLSKDGFEVVPWYELADLYNKTERLFRNQVRGIHIVLAAIILLSILNAVTISVIERTGEIGTSLALGVKRSGILRMFVYEGVLIGLLGGLVGICAGILLAFAISAIGIPMPPPPGVTHGYTSAVDVTPVIVMQAFILAVVTTLIGSIYPAWAASRRQVVDALRHNR